MRKSKKFNKFFIMSLLALVLTLAFGMTTMAAPKIVSLNNKKWYTDQNKKYSQTVYHKITVPRTGLVTVNGYSFSNYSDSKFSLYFKLCNNKKREIQSLSQNMSSYNKYATYFAVKKGTYYLKITGTNYRLKYSFKTLTDKSGSRKTTARAVKKNQVAKGMIVASDKSNKIDWYKITLTKPQKIKLTYSALASDWITFKIVPANPNIWIIGASASRKNSTATVTTKSEFPAGTYYIQVSRMVGSGNTSGYYSFKWR